MPTYCGINGVVRKLKEWPVGVGGVVHQQKEVWAAEGGVKKKIFSTGSPIWNYSVGDTINLDEASGSKEFIIVHKGIPSSSYDSSCDGVWVMRKLLIPNCPYQIGSAYYENSTLFQYVNTTYYNTLSATVKSAIKTVKIPYISFAYGTETYKTGANGLSCRCFNLSGWEAGAIDSYGEAYRHVGSKLDYFLTGNTQAAWDRRKAIYEPGGFYYPHGLRDPYGSVGTSDILIITDTGGFASYSSSYRIPPRPVFVLDKNFIV